MRSSVDILDSKIGGLTATPDGKLLYTDGTNKVYRTADFETVETAYGSVRPVSDVAIDVATTPVRYGFGSTLEPCDSTSGGVLDVDRGLRRFCFEHRRRRSWR